MVKISLPLSATALRHGSDLLLKLAADAEVIRSESAPAASQAFDCAEYFHAMTATAGAEAVPPDVPAEGALYNIPASADGLGFDFSKAERVIPSEFSVSYPASGLPSPVLNIVELQLHQAPAEDAMLAATDAPFDTGNPEMDATLVAGQAKLEALGAFDAPPPPAPVFDLQMTDKAGAWSLAEFREQGWTDDNLVEAGYAERVARPFTSAPAPAVPSVPPAPDTAPNASNNSGASSGASVELDKNGLPWDPRIHSDAANKLTAEGRWKRKRGVSDGLVTQVEAELRAVMAVPSPVAQAANQMSALSATLAPVALNAPTPATFADDPATFPALTLWLSGHLNGGRIAQADVALAVQSTGLALLPDLNKRPDLIPAVVEHLRRNRGL